MRKLITNMTEWQKVYRQNPNIVSRTILDETILVPVRQSMSDFESIYTLNETADFAWSLFDGVNDLGKIRDKIIIEYDVDQEEAEADLHELVIHLLEIGAIEEA